MQIYVDAGRPRQTQPTGTSADEQSWTIACCHPDGTLIEKAQALAPSSFRAEMKALDLGLKHAHALRATVLYTDCIGLIDLIRSNRTHPRADDVEALREWGKSVRNLLWWMPYCEIKHVKGKDNPAHRWTQKPPH